MANTVNAALKPLETLSRIVNQPSSLFGGKGASSKNKTEHDAVGTVRDSNSNTQDSGNAKIINALIILTRIIVRIQWRVCNGLYSL